MNIYVTKVFEGNYTDIDNFKQSEVGQRIQTKQDSFDNSQWDEELEIRYQEINGDVVAELGFVDMNQREQFAIHVTEGRTWSEGVPLEYSKVDESDIDSNSWVS